MRSNRGPNHERQTSSSPAHSKAPLLYFSGDRHRKTIDYGGNHMPNRKNTPITAETSAPDLNGRVQSFRHLWFARLMVLQMSPYSGHLQQSLSERYGAKPHGLAACSQRPKPTNETAHAIAAFKHDIPTKNVRANVLDSLMVFHNKTDAKNAGN